MPIWRGQEPEEPGPERDQGGILRDGCMEQYRCRGQVRKKEGAEMMGQISIFDLLPEQGIPAECLCNI